MPQHLMVAYSSYSTAQTEQDTPFAADPTMPRNSANHILLPGQWTISGAYGLGLNLTRARIAATKLRQLYLPYVWPFDKATAVPANPSFCDFRDRPLQLAPNDELEVDLTAAPAGAENYYLGLFLEKGREPMPAGKPIFPIRATAAITATANAWTSGSLTFGQTLPPGDYAVVGLDVQSATGVFARLIFPGTDVNVRPGTIARTGLDKFPMAGGNRGMWGVMGRFNNFAPPSLEIFCTAADTAQVVHMDLMPLY